MIINIYEKKLFYIRYIYNNMYILKVSETNLDLWNVKINKQTKYFSKSWNTEVLWYVQIQPYQLFPLIS